MDVTEILTVCQLYAQQQLGDMYAGIIPVLILSTVGGIIAYLMARRARKARQTEYPIDNTDWPEDYWKK